MSKELKYGRRNFLVNSAKSFVAAEFAMIGLANAPTGKINASNNLGSKNDANRSFNEIKQINAGVLNIGYVDEGPANGPVVIL